MNRYLPEGFLLRIPGIKEEYVIKKLVGTGASVVAYEASYQDTNGCQRTCIVKEFCPGYIKTERDDDGKILVPEDLTEKYEKGLSRFRDGCVRQIELKECETIRNQTPASYGPYEANNTLYFLVDKNTGNTLDSCLDKMPIAKRVNVMLSLAKLVSFYHREGYLCLDLKPENILVLPETEELIQMIDYDSIIRKTEAVPGIMFSYTGKWAAPEQKSPFFSDSVSEKTDVYLLGEMLFWVIFERNSNETEHRGFTDYPFAEVVEKWPELDRKPVQELITGILQKSIRSAVKNRYNSVQEFVDSMEVLLEKIRKPVYIKDTILPGKDFFVGRNEEMVALDDALTTSQCVFVSGMPGIGKTELVKHYWYSVQKRYENCIWIPFRTTLQDSLSDDTALSVTGIRRYNRESNLQYANRKTRRLTQMASGHELLIIDNADDISFISTDLWIKLQETGVKIVVITRQKISEYPCIEVHPFENWDYLRKIYIQYAPFEPAETAYVDDIIRCVGGHTQLVELLAKQTRSNYYTPEKMFCRLKMNGIDFLEGRSLSVLKDNRTTVDVIQNHVAALFSVEHLTSECRRIMLAAILMPSVWVRMQDFMAFWGIDNNGSITWLEDRGWLQIVKKEQYYLTVHPAIALAVFRQVTENEMDYVAVLERLFKMIGRGYDRNSVLENYWREFEVFAGTDKTDTKEAGDYNPGNGNILADLGSEIIFDEYSRFCDSAVEKMIYYDPKSEYTYYLVLFYCQQFRKNGNYEQKIDWLEKMYDVRKSCSQRTEYGVYVDLLLEMKRYKDALFVWYNQLFGSDQAGTANVICTIFRHFSKIKNEDFIWLARVSIASLGIELEDVNEPFALRIGSILIAWRLGKRKRMPVELRNEVCIRLGDLYECLAAREWLIPNEVSGKYDSIGIDWYKKAIKYRKEVTAANYSVKCGNTLMLAYDQAQVCRLKQRIEEAQKILYSVITENQNMQYNDVAALFEIYNLFVELCLYKKEFSDAEYFAKMAIENAKKLGEDKKLSSRYSLGLVCICQEKYNEAGEIFSQLLEETTDLEDDIDYMFLRGGSMYQMGEVCALSKKYDEAISWYEKSDLVLRDCYFFDLSIRCDAFQRIARIYFGKKDYPRAVEYMEKAASLYKSVSHSKRVPKELSSELRRYRSFL